MAKLTPDATYTANGVKVNVKIIPDGTRWTDAAKAKAAGFTPGALYKKQAKLNKGTGKPKFVTIHNTGDLAGVNDDAEQYTRATWPNQNMNSSRVHFYVDNNGAWQTLKAGTGMVPQDPVGSAEVSWHAGDGSSAGGGNESSLSIEIIMGENSANDTKAKENGARLAAWLLTRNGLTINDLVTHTYWVNRKTGKTFADRVTQSTNPVKGGKWCPTYILGSTGQARANWTAFQNQVKSFMDSAGSAPAPAPQKPPAQVAGQKIETAKYHNAVYSRAWTVTARDGLHIRTGAGTDRTDLGTIPYGDKVHCYGYFNKAANGQAWLCAVWEGITGYCSKAYLK